MHEAITRADFYVFIAVFFVFKFMNGAAEDEKKRQKWLGTFFGSIALGFALAGAIFVIAQSI